VVWCNNEEKIRGVEEVDCGGGKEDRRRRVTNILYIVNNIWSIEVGGVDSERRK